MNAITHSFSAESLMSPDLRHEPLPTAIVRHIEGLTPNARLAFEDRRGLVRKCEALAGACRRGETLSDEQETELYTLLPQLLGFAKDLREMCRNRELRMIDRGLIRHGHFT